MSHFSDEEQKKLDDFLKKIEYQINHLDLSDRNKIIEEIKSHITETVSGSGQTLNSIIYEYRDYVSLANQFLIKNGHKKISKRKNFLKYFLLATAFTTVFGGIILAVMIKSFLPIFEVNEKEGNIKILGSTIVLDMDDESFMNRMQSKSKDLVVKLKGEFEATNFTAINIKALNSDFQIGQSVNANISYNCKASESIDDFLKTSNSLIEFNLKSVNSRCIFKIPKGMEISLNVTNGIVKLNTIENPFGVKVLNGLISWRVGIPQKFYATTSVNNGVIIGPRPDAVNPEFEANLEIMNGNIIINN